MTTTHTSAPPSGEPTQTSRRIRRVVRTTAMFLAALASLAACESANGVGGLSVHVYGEEFIEEGLMADDMDDGWTVAFDRFVVAIADVSVGGVEMPLAAPVDISVATGGAGQPISSTVALQGEYTDSSFAITRMEVSGSAMRDGVVKTFDWVFDEDTDYAFCETVTTVAPGANAVFQITVHADHFFYDSLVAEEPQVLFQALADADTNADGHIDRTELEARDIGGYDPGSAGNVNDLWSWLVAQSRTVGHVDGEGHCASSARPI